ncbi:heterokaryon incompatibility protein [Hirsutella rhossiliensis]|uniref:Heterokaryon incompatibility protein (HET) domain-containing protein n=1 Tax=Hirsutella rhossiliensis TaxID=111463 RepID=A0A9P8MTP4_9HYPO|nr:heterokaryon incompatibility protein (HET) domain-containing protein [Hirsutella rhossiliensis]KAH0961090.1 heterokaryon incompatibility protein (HET) domain-containing protein [Hirsutella rhossiliensis]
MADSNSLDPGLAAAPDRPGLQRRRSKNPLKNMMQHLTVEPATADDDGSPRRESLIRRISWRKSRSPSAHSEASSSAAPLASLPNADPALCPACTSIAADIDTTLDDVDASYVKAVNPAADDGFDNRESHIARLKGLEDNRWTATCPLCKLFWAIRVPGDGDGDYCLSAFSTRDSNYLIDPISMFDSRHPAGHKAPGLAPAFLAVVPKKKGPAARDWIVSPDWFRQAGMLLRTVPPSDLALQLEPRRGRSPAPGRRAAEPPVLAVNDATPETRGIWGREIGRSADMAIAQDWLRFCQSHHQGRCQRSLVTAELPGFHLIDCAATPPRVVPASISQDYVALSYVAGKDVAEPWSRVVRDAIAVTKDLGLRHLWVDRLCIDDSRPEDKAQQVARMDDVFEGAVLTIIAAHGDDAMQGLPGVGSTPRPPQPNIEESTWYTRGWTYQEGLLARRRLVFTEQQMYWECDGMLSPETLVLPLDHYHDPQQQRMCDFVRPGLFNGAAGVDGTWRAWKKLPKPDEEPSIMSVFRAADQHIVNYSKRHLRYDEDSLSAFLGIPELFALATSFWHHKSGGSGSGGATRRRHLPSWTWAGWKGPVELFSSIVVADSGGGGKDRKLLNHHYVSATHLARNDQPSPNWTYSPNIVLLGPDGNAAYDFFSQAAPRLAQGRYRLRVSDPLVLDRVKARTHAGGWMFNDVSVDVRLSRGGGTDQSGATTSGLRDYVERHARGEQVTVLWFVEEATVMLLVVERTGATGAWERVGRARMAFAQEAKEVVRRFGRLEVMLNHLPLRRLGHDMVIE